MTRSLRADAARNRSMLLAAAAEEFASRGMSASVADIARRAGVGKGTVFRHFPTKDDLLAAIVLDRIESLAALARKLYLADDAGQALFDFLDEAAGRQQQLDFSFLRDSGDINDQLRDAREGLYVAIIALVERAQAVGAVRTDVTGLDVILMMCVPAHVVSFVPGAAPDLWRRYLAMVIDGLRPEGAHPLGPPSPAAV
ncbi:AcrR family transcriptional regulator [Actinoplanes tereljensis]|uniref:TetR family transcriptional regulator n=1 Tax=Paractinoplanes tereljensis TaxID=571912 RepID=A0A919TXX4_9ACTN|nr:TetR/AcrR family transcriptional regulator [Actinoplanes tereljensis]GIF26841.1 TetR family transcriptional regulator [Actinoplanes tereljensis]